MEYETRPAAMDDYDAIYSLWNAAEQSRCGLIHHLCADPGFRRMGIALFLQQVTRACS